MKKLHTSLSIFFLLLFWNHCIYGQNSNSIGIVYTRPPLNQLRADDIWNFNLKNNTNQELNFYLYGTLKEKTAGLIATGKTAAIRLQPNESKKFRVSELPSAPEINYVHSDPRYKEALMRAGNLPDGTYEICVVAKNASDNEELSMDECMEVERKANEEISMELLSPEKNETFDSTALPGFKWITMPQIKEAIYNLRIFEIGENQNPQEVLNTNKYFNEIKNLKAASYNYKLTDKKFKTDKTYYWNIAVFSGSSEIFKSEFSSFSFNKTDSIGRNRNCMLRDEAVPLRTEYYCLGDSYSKTYNANGTLSWSVSPTTNISGPTSGSSTGSIHTIRFTTNSPGSSDIEYSITYSFNFDNPSCTDISGKTSKVKFHANPQINAATTSLCVDINQTIDIDNLAGISLSPDNNGLLTATGPGISISGTDITFDPAIAGAGLHTVTLRFERPAPTTFPRMSGCIATEVLTIFVKDRNIVYTAIAISPTICQGTSTEVSVQGIPNGVTGYSFQWFMGTPAANGCANPVPVGGNSPSFNTDLNLPPGSYCFYCEITDPCGGTPHISQTAAVIVTPSLSNVQLTSPDLSLCSTAPESDRTVVVRLDNYSGNTQGITWSAVTGTNIPVPEAATDTDPLTYTAIVSASTTFTATVPDCGQTTRSFNLTIDVLDPPPPGRICIRPGTPCCSAPDPCSNYIEIQEGCDASISMLGIDNNLYPPDFTIVWSYIEENNFTDYSNGFLSNLQNNFPSNPNSTLPSYLTSGWQSLIPTGDNRYWNTNPVYTTTFYKVEIQGPLGCPVQTLYGAIFVIPQIQPPAGNPFYRFEFTHSENPPDLPISVSNSAAVYGCNADVNLDVNFNPMSFARPAGFNVKYQWEFTGVNNITTSISTGTWEYNNPWPSPPVNVTDLGILKLTLSNSCYSYNDDYVVKLPDYPGGDIQKPCCICRGETFQIILTDTWDSYEWDATIDGVTIVTNQRGNEATITPPSGFTGAFGILITFTYGNGTCTVISNPHIIQVCE